jgi:uncharacterized protein YjcR
MQGGSAGSGAPNHNQNALKHGLFTKEARKERKQLNELLRASRKTLQTLK